jgi:hypothetical protein
MALLFAFFDWRETSRCAGLIVEYIAINTIRIALIHDELSGLYSCHVTRKAGHAYLHMLTVSRTSLARSHSIRDSQGKETKK